MGIIAVVIGFPVYLVAVVLVALFGPDLGTKAGKAVLVIALLLAALLLYAIGWGVAQNGREEVAARDAQKRMGRHLTDRDGL